jgi:hypothetical protein
MFSIPYYLLKVKYKIKGFERNVHPFKKEGMLEENNKFTPTWKEKEVNKETSRFAKGDQGRHASLTHT